MANIFSIAAPVCPCFSVSMPRFPDGAGFAAVTAEPAVEKKATRQSIDRRGQLILFYYFFDELRRRAPAR